MDRRYTNPDAAGYLLEADACKKVEAELRRIADKYQRKIDREQAAREAEFEAAMQYRSENELLDAYGWEIITEKQYEIYLDLFRCGREALENHAPTVNEVAHRILLSILSDIAAEQREWRFSALTPTQRSSVRRKRNRNGVRNCGRSERIWTSPRNPKSHVENEWNCCCHLPRTGCRSR